jgi:hypothetical protein
MSKNEIPKKVFEKKIINFTTRVGNFLAPKIRCFSTLCSEVTPYLGFLELKIETY